MSSTTHHRRVENNNSSLLLGWIIAVSLLISSGSSLELMFASKRLLPRLAVTFISKVRHHRRPSTTTSLLLPTFVGHFSSTTTMSSSTPAADIPSSENVNEKINHGTNHSNFTTTASSPSSSSSSSSSSSTTTLTMRQPFPDHLLAYDFYDGVTIRLDRGVPWENGDASNFRQCLEDALHIWQMEGRRGIWIQVPKELSFVVPHCMELGFTFHSVLDPNMLMLSRWLPTDTPSRLPFGPTHQVGVGIFVTSPYNTSQMLVVRERTGPAAARRLWKMPTGLVDPGEEIGPAAIRELQEETGLSGIFQGILCFRHAPNQASGRSISDLFFVCQVQLNMTDDVAAAAIDDTTTDSSPTATDHHNGNDRMMNKLLLANRTQRQKEEIADIRWMSIVEYAQQETWQQSPVYRELNQVLLDRVMMATTTTTPGAKNGSDSSNSTPSLLLLRAHLLPIGFAPGTNTLYKSSNCDGGDDTLPPLKSNL